MSANRDVVDLPLLNRLLVVALVVAAHASLAWTWLMLPSVSKPVRHELSVSIRLPEPPKPAPPEAKPPEPPKPKPKPPEPPKPKPEPPKPKPEPPKPKPKPPEPKPAPKPEPVEESVPAEPQPKPVEVPDAPVEAPSSEETSSAPSQPTGDPHAPASPAQEPDREPDYQAAYLKNPPPSYPMVARRMGWQGRVVLNVEVLASGLPGQIDVHQSSGHDVLDKAALKAVSKWRFVAARQNGQVVAKRFLVPIPFILREAE